MSSKSVLNIVIPMAGRGSRFAEAGYTLPKPLIPVHSQPIIRWVIENLKPIRPHRFLFLAQASHIQKFSLQQQLPQWAGSSAQVLPVSQVTEGAACTVLLAKDFIQNEDPLLIANSDQFINFPIDEFLGSAESQKTDGLIMTMKANDPKWSYARANAQGWVEEVAEKKVISQDATVGIYHFRRGIDFVQNAEAMIQANDRTKGEFYVAPVYNYMIRKNLKVGLCPIGTDAEDMHGLGTPEDLKKFIAHPISQKARRAWQW